MSAAAAAAADDRFEEWAWNATLPDVPISLPCAARLRCLACAAAAVVLLGAQLAAAAETVAVLQGLNKITARVSTIEAPLERPVRFGTLEITVRTCHKAPPEKPPESAAYLDIRDLKPGERPTELFLGWMFASSPALSALEHPVYDIWVLDCRVADEPGISKSPLPPPPPE